MVTRYVFLKLNDEHSHPAGRSAAADTIRRALAEVPAVQAATVGVCADAHAEKAWDIGLQVSLESLDQLDAYLEHPAHRAVVDDYLAPRLACIKAWNFAP